MKLLLVDDDVFLRDMYATKFTEAGHEVAVAENAPDAFSLLEDGGPFDVVLLDMVMPGVTGKEFLKKVQQLTSAKATKYIVLSNQGEQSDIDEAKAAGAVGYIVKAESIPSQVVEKVEALAN